jgi:hypothetical protein
MAELGGEILGLSLVHTTTEADKNELWICDRSFKKN